jgi:hypothetical protein
VDAAALFRACHAYRWVLLTVFWMDSVIGLLSGCCCPEGVTF